MTRMALHCTDDGKGLRDAITEYAYLIHTVRNLLVLREAR